MSDAASAFYRRRSDALSRRRVEDAALLERIRDVYAKSCRRAQGARHNPGGLLVSPTLAIH